MTPSGSFFKKVLKTARDQVQQAAVGLARRLGVIDFPVPPASSMSKTSSRSIRHYYISGIRSSLPIMTCALRERLRLDESIRILDFGCGVGRQLLHFTRHFPKPEYHACDIDQTSIAFVSENYPAVSARTTGFEPPLPYEDGFFDMIYSVSIFSHLAPGDQAAWLAELGRVTKPGGMCFVTTEGRTALGKVVQATGEDPNKARLELDERGILYKEYPFLEEVKRTGRQMPRASLLVGVTGSYGNTIITPEHIRREWSNAAFDVLDIVEGIIDFRQDLIILKRKL